MLYYQAYRLLSLLIIDISHHNLGTRAGVMLCDRTAKTRSGARHQGYLTFQRSIFYSQLLIPKIRIRPRKTAENSREVTPTSNGRRPEP
ncbi:hypothetical protein D3C78_1365550 [compost metagenome]